VSLLSQKEWTNWAWHIHATPVAGLARMTGTGGKDFKKSRANLAGSMGSELSRNFQGTANSRASNARSPELVRPVL
jgi:hypothetical protein